jgi:UDP-2,3-diacylglucosamine pyrophosphatase LpxH
MAGRSATEKALDQALQRAQASAQPLDLTTSRYIVFSDHHKGKRDGADDFARCERAYVGALKHYAREGYTLIVLGDAEELWECQPRSVIGAYDNILELERRFFPDRYLRVYGNHDDEWESPRRVRRHLSPFFPDLDVPEALYFEVADQGAALGGLFLVHGHQGSLFSDRLAGVAKLFVRFIWRSFQRLTRKPSTTPATDACLRDEHDKTMYDWAARQSGIVTIAGHTHRPVFNSKTHLQQLEEELAPFLELPLNQADADYDGRVAALRAKIEHVRTKDRQCDEAAGGQERSTPCYFNSGCCSFGDGDITGLEIAEGEIRLVRWPDDDGTLRPKVLARSGLKRVFEALG